MVVFGKSGCSRAKLNVLGQKLIVLGKVVVFDQSSCNRVKADVFRQSGCFVEKWLCWG